MVKMAPIMLVLLLAVPMASSLVAVELQPETGTGVTAVEDFGNNVTSLISSLIPHEFLLYLGRVIQTLIAAIMNGEGLDLLFTTLQRLAAFISSIRQNIQQLEIQVISNIVSYIQVLLQTIFGPSPELIPVDPVTSITKKSVNIRAEKQLLTSDTITMATSTVSNAVQQVAYIMMPLFERLGNEIANALLVVQSVIQNGGQGFGQLTELLVQVGLSLAEIEMTWEEIQVDVVDMILEYVVMLIQSFQEQPPTPAPTTTTTLQPTTTGVTTEDFMGTTEEYSNESTDEPDSYGYDSYYSAEKSAKTGSKGGNSQGKSAGKSAKSAKSKTSKGGSAGGSAERKKKKGRSLHRVFAANIAA